MTSLFHESGMHPPARAAFAMSQSESSSPGGGSLSISVVTPLSPAAFHFAAFFQWLAYSCFVVKMMSPSVYVTIPV